MMMTEITDKKKLAAAIAGVAAYLQAEQEAVTAASMAGPPKPPAKPIRLWGISGRQAQMMNRQLMQMRTFR